VSRRARHAAAPLVLAAALPFLFLHVSYQPSFSIGRVDVFLSDVAVLAIVVTALLVGARALPPARPERLIWVSWGGLAALVLLGTAWGAVRFGAYPAGTHAVTAAKWCEYMILAPAVFLIARRARDLVPAALVLTCWSAAATLVGILQFFGVLGNLDHTPAGGRKPSFLGTHDFAALSGASLVLGLTVLGRGSQSRRERGFLWVACVAGAVGMVLAGAFDALLGELLAAVAIVVLTPVRDRRRRVVIAAVMASILVGTVGIRSQAVADGLKFLGIKHGTGGAGANVQSYRQRALLAYIGGRIFLDHPILGVGYDGSVDAYAYEPYVADAKRLISQPDFAFPSPAHPWGVQNAYVQSLADFGVLGLPIFLAALLVPAAVAIRRGAGDVRVAGVGLLLLCLGAWNGFGLIAGIPVAALTWLAVGVAAASLRSSLTERR
jgi:hypothetical protein